VLLTRRLPRQETPKLQIESFSSSIDRSISTSAGITPVLRKGSRRWRRGVEGIEVWNGHLCEGRRVPATHGDMPINIRVAGEQTPPYAIRHSIRTAREGGNGKTPPDITPMSSTN